MGSTLTVFLCSTFSDLSAEREAVLDAARRLQLQHDSMEFFGARAQQPIETCLEEVRKSDILVVIVGHKYGSIVQDLGVSYSEAEYSEGYRLGKPCLVYIRNENVPVLPKHVERVPEKMRLLDKWKETLQKRHTIASFSDGHGLAVQVAADLGRTVRSLEEADKMRREAAKESQHTVHADITEIIENALTKGVPEQSIVSTVRRAVSSLLSTIAHQPATVFLSYAHPDQKIVQKIAAGLTDAGVNVWFDQTALAPGSNFIREIERGLDSSDFVVFFISPSSMASQWTQQELNVAISRQVSGAQKTVILPILLAEAEMPPLLRTIAYLDLRDQDSDKAVKQLLKAIEHHKGEKQEVN